MNEPYKVNCIEAKYDEDEEVLVLNCVFEGGLGQRIVILSRDDFHYKHHGNDVPHSEMHKTARMFKGKPFYLHVEDDPNLQNMSDDDKRKYVQMFSKEIGDYMEASTRIIQSDDHIFDRKKEDLLRNVVRGRL